MRAHFVPEPGVAFSGHIYVRGFFFSRDCHLDYTQHALTEPFYFHIPYRGGVCAASSARSVEPPGRTYTLVIVVQHHPLLLTDTDRAYSLSCFYRDDANELEQSVQVA